MDKFICVGKNYVDHAKELGDAIPKDPILFLKPPSTAVFIKNGESKRITLPNNRGTIHFECEIILLLTASGKIDSVSIGLDMTLRDVQAELKKQGHPWEAAKVFQNSAIVGPWIPIQQFPHYLDEPFQFYLDGQLRQRACGKEMRALPETCLTYAQQLFPIQAGDILFTGTPAGVGPVRSGQIGEVQWGNYLNYKVQFE